MVGGMSNGSQNPDYYYETLSEDTPEALAEGGFDDEFEERRAPAVAEDVGVGRAVRLFYRHYWNDRGEASASEFRGAVLYLVVGTVLYFGLTFVLNRLIVDEDASSLLRTLFMFCVITNPLWVVINLIPLKSLMRRRKNAVHATAAGA